MIRGGSDRKERSNKVIKEEMEMKERNKRISIVVERLRSVEK